MQYPAIHVIMPVEYMYPGLGMGLCVTQLHSVTLVFMYTQPHVLRVHNNNEIPYNHKSKINSLTLLKESMYKGSLIIWYTKHVKLVGAKYVQ